MSLNKGQRPTLAVTRDRRANAGSKMSQLLDAEDEDFYKTTYGGFTEEVEDNDYSTEDSDSDDVDSDFDIDENDELMSEDDGDGEKRKTRRNVYIEPKKRSAPKSASSSSTMEKRPKVSIALKSKDSSIRTLKRLSTDGHQSISKKSFRESTKRNAAETEARVRIAREESEARRKTGKSYYGHDRYRQLTQDEMLREAKKTETINLRSLERYRRMELEKSKKNKIVKETIKGPIIRYQSVAMPLVQEIDNEKNDDTNMSEANNSPSKCSRTFISFTDEDTFKKYFPDRRPPVSRPKLFCPISHLQGRYFDPVTQLPYANANTFRAMREAYYKQLEQLGDMRQPEVAKWVNWRRRTMAVRIGQIQPRIIQIIK